MPFIHKNLQTFSQWALNTLVTLTDRIKRLPEEDRTAFSLIENMLNKISRSLTNLGAFYELSQSQNSFLSHPYVLACLEQGIKIERGGLEVIRQTKADSLLLQFIDSLLQPFIHQEVNLSLGFGGLLVKAKIREDLKCPPDSKLSQFLLEYMQTTCAIVDEVIRGTLLSREQCFQASVELIHEMSVILKPLRSLSPFGELRESLSLLEASVIPDETDSAGRSAADLHFPVIERTSDLLSEVERIFYQYCDAPTVRSLSEEQALNPDIDFETIVETLFHHVSNLIIIAYPDALEKKTIQFIKYEAKLREAFLSTFSPDEIDDVKTVGDCSPSIDSDGSEFSSTSSTSRYSLHGMPPPPASPAEGVSNGQAPSSFRQ